MLKTLRGIIKVGNATINYPFAPLKRPKDVRGKPEHDSLNCIACAACATACPPNAIQMQADLAAGTTSWSINYGRCIFCGRCEEVCPTKALRLSEEFELAVLCKDDLEEVCVYELQSCLNCGAFYASSKEVAYAKQILGKTVQTEAANADEGKIEEGKADEDKDILQSIEMLTVCPACKSVLDANRAHKLHQ